MKLLIVAIAAVAWCLLAGTVVRAHDAYYVDYDPCCGPRVAVTAYYAPRPVVYQPAAVVHTRYRPLLGGYVTRARYGYPSMIYFSGW